MFARPHPAGRPFIAAGVVIALLGVLLGAWLGWLGTIFTLFCLYFFRDPERVAPGRPTAILAPADGRVVSIG
ncbi:MAG TPA: phosphatidylserine decarboxylase, partial [Acetobacteraceae bacterium]